MMQKNLHQILNREGNGMIRLENVNKYFGELHVLKDVNLTVAEGEKLVIIGPSGSGKSTTVRCMNFWKNPAAAMYTLTDRKSQPITKRKLSARIWPWCSSSLISTPI